MTRGPRRASRAPRGAAGAASGPIHPCRTCEARAWHKVPCAIDCLGSGAGSRAGRTRAHGLRSADSASSRGTHRFGAARQTQSLRPVSRRGTEHVCNDELPGRGRGRVDPNWWMHRSNQHCHPRAGRGDCASDRGLIITGLHPPPTPPSAREGGPERRGWRGCANPPPSQGGAGGGWTRTGGCIARIHTALAALVEAIVQVIGG